MIGQLFGRLTVISYSHTKRRGAKYYQCICSCGNKTLAIGYNLKNGNTKSCGCLHKEVTSEIHSTHKESRSAEYRIWAGLLSRCRNPNNIGYYLYGGRGISVEWQDFNTFLRDMGRRPFKNAQIDRIDNDKNYCASNCRWVSPTQNANNKRNNRKLTFNGMTKTISEWSAHTGIKYQTLDTRRRAGWGVEDILTTPIKFTPKHHARRA